MNEAAASMPTDVIIRIADATDLDVLVGLAIGFRIHLGQSTPSDDDLRHSFARLIGDADTEFFLACSASGRGIGYVQCRYRYSAWTTGIEAELDDVFVAGECRRRGVGQRLMAFAIARTTSKGCRALGLNTNERNTEAIALYRRLGFAAERARWQGGRQLWMLRSLDP